MERSTIYIEKVWHGIMKTTNMSPIGFFPFDSCCDFSILPHKITQRNVWVEFELWNYYTAIVRSVQSIATAFVSPLTYSVLSERSLCVLWTLVQTCIYMTHTPVTRSTTTICSLRTQRREEKKTQTNKEHKLPTQAHESPVPGGVYGSVSVLLLSYRLFEWKRTISYGERIRCYNSI